MCPSFYLKITAHLLFTDPLSSYKRKDDLIALCGALGLKMTGTVPELLTELKSHFSSHPEIQQNPRFSGLFLQNRRRRVDNFDSNSAVDTTVV